MNQRLKLKLRPAAEIKAQIVALEKEEEAHYISGNRERAHFCLAAKHALYWALKYHDDI